MMNDFAKVLAGSLWLMDARHFKAIVDRCATATPKAIQAAAVAFSQRQQTPTMVGDIAVINCCGPITYRNSYFSMWYGSTTIEGMQAQLRAALQDPAVRTIVFRVDSPGGTSEMIPEFADEIFGARGQKPMYAIADTAMCSAAYWLFSQTDTIYAPRSSGYIGSVGAYILHEEISGMLERIGVKVTFIQYGENKTLGNMLEPLSDVAEAVLQTQINECGVEFDTYVARARGVTKAVVKDTFGQGLVFSGVKAQKLGMIDKLGTFDQVMAKLAPKRRAGVQAATVAGTDGLGNEAEALTTTATVVAPVAKKSDAVDPDENGNCPDGYEKRDDMCYPIEQDDDESAKAERAAADRDAINIAIALGAE